MVKNPIVIKDLNIEFGKKVCFKNFSYCVRFGDKIGVFGANGSGKSTLLKILANVNKLDDASVIVDSNAIIGYVPQFVEYSDKMSGSESVNVAITNALKLNPNILLLDEPTNHLDKNNRASLMRMIRKFEGVVITVSHDRQLLRNCNVLWHIKNEKVNVFVGNYDHYIEEMNVKHKAVQSKIHILKKQKKQMHEKLMFEQKRAAKSRIKGQRNIANNKYDKITGSAKAMNAQNAQGKKLKDIDDEKILIKNELQELRQPQNIMPKFVIKSSCCSSNEIISIKNGSVGYINCDPVLFGINISIMNGDRVAIVGNNASGKSTLIKAIVASQDVYVNGLWDIINNSYIGYLDQNYRTLDCTRSVFDTIACLMSQFSEIDIRRYLANFLFYNKEDIDKLVKNLSGGERVRLSLAQIAFKNPRLLILDEITNNLDLETKIYIEQVLLDYDGTIIAISHDEDFYQISELTIK